MIPEKTPRPLPPTPPTPALFVSQVATEVAKVWPQLDLPDMSDTMLQLKPMTCADFDRSTAAAKKLQQVIRDAYTPMEDGPRKTALSDLFNRITIVFITNNSVMTGLEQNAAVIFSLAHKNDG